MSDTNKERAAFEAWWFDPKTPDNGVRYELTVDDMRRMAEDVTWKAWQARAALAERPASTEYTGVRCMCVVTGCRADQGCPQYTAHCKAHIDAMTKEHPNV